MTIVVVTGLGGHGTYRDEERMAVKAKRRRLGELYVVGRELKVDDGSGDPVELYMRRPNPFEHEEALRDGNAARARTALRMRDGDSEEFSILEADLQLLGDVHSRVTFLIGESAGDIFDRAYAQVSAEDEWSKEALIDSIQDSFEMYQRRVPALVEGDDEWGEYQSVLKSIDKFNAQVQKRCENLAAEDRMELLDEPEEEIAERVRGILIDRSAGVTFYKEYRISCLFYAVREPADHTQRYFHNKQEIRELPFEVQKILLDEYNTLDLSRDDAKNSQSAAPSSPESAPSDPVETSESSGPEK